MLYHDDFSPESPKCYKMCMPWPEGRITVAETGYNRVPPGLKQIMKRDLYIIHYVVAGKGRYMNKFFSAGDCYMVVPNEREEIVADKNDPYECYWIMFRGTGAVSVLKNCGLPVHNDVFKFKHTKECAELIRRNFEDKSLNPLAETAKMFSVLYEILAMHLEASGGNISKSDITENIAKFIEDNYQHSIKIKDLAEKFCISQSHLELLFKKKYGIPPQEYLISVRIERAKEILKKHETSVKETAFSAGFDNPLYFSRLFKKKTGIAPSLFE